MDYEAEIMTAVVENKTFEEKMKARIKESIGDLIGDEDLKRLLDSAMQDVFFKPSKIKINSYDYKDGPSFLQEIVKELMEPIVREQIKQYINTNQDTVDKVIGEVVQEGVGMSMVKAMHSLFQQDLYTLQNNIHNRLVTKGI